MNAYENKAHELANWLETGEVEEIDLKESANMLRQQADLIRNLQKTLGFLRSGYESINLTPQTNPLSDEEIHELANQHLRTQDHDGAKVVTGLEDFARAIEERHGIK